jgi:hypothetical protein
MYPFCPRNYTAVFGLVNGTLLHFPSLEGAERACGRLLLFVTDIVMRRRREWSKLKL